MTDFMMDGLGLMKEAQAAMEEAANSAGYDPHYVGKIIQRVANCGKAEVVLCVESIDKLTIEDSSRMVDTGYHAKYIEIRLSCATATEAVVAFAGLQRGYYVAYDDNHELTAVLSGSFDE